MESLTVRPAARLTLFGFAATQAAVAVVRRPRAWRVRKAATALGLGVLAAPFAAIVPPHIPWALLALGIGAYQFFRYWRQEEELVELNGTCPKCGAAQQPDLPTRLKRPLHLTCPSCHQDLHLEVAATE